MLVTRIDEEKQGTTHKETKQRIAHPDSLHKSSHNLSEPAKHQQEIISLEQKLQTQVSVSKHAAGQYNVKGLSVRHV